MRYVHGTIPVSPGFARKVELHHEAEAKNDEMIERELLRYRSLPPLTEKPKDRIFVPHDDPR